MVSPGRGSGKAKAARGDGESCPCGGRCPPVWQVRIFSGLRTARSPKTAYSDAWRILPGTYPAV